MLVNIGWWAQVIDLRESPVGDSEVSSFGWVGSLEELYVSPAMEAPAVHKHAHYIGDNIPEHVELDDWEMEVSDLLPTPLPPHRSRQLLNAYEPVCLSALRFQGWGQ